MPIHVLFAGQNFNFMQELIHCFGNDPAFSIKFDKWSGHIEHNEEQSRALLQWADIIVANWLLGNAVWYSQHKRPDQKLIIRYHRFEITTDFPKLLNLGNVDQIVSTSRIFQPHIERLLQLPKEKSTYIYNPINTKVFQMNKKVGSEFHLGMAGYNRKLKGLHRALDIWEQLVQVDSRYTLFLKGYKPQEITWVWRDPDEYAYFEVQFARIASSPYKNNIVFETYGNDVPDWLSNIGFIMSMSDIESFHCAAAEGMASGSIPVISGWEGAETIYPHEFIHRDPTQMVHYIQAVNANQDIYMEKQRKSRSYAEQHFDVHRIFEQFKALLLQ